MSANTRGDGQERDEQQIALLFRTLDQPVRDDGFTSAVTRRVRYRAWRRAGILGVAVIAGMAVALQPMIELARWLGLEITLASGNWHALAVLLQSPLVLGALALAAMVAGAAQWLEE